MLPRVAPIPVARKPWTPKARSPAVGGKEKTSARARRRQPPAQEFAQLPPAWRDFAFARGAARRAEWVPWSLSGGQERRARAGPLLVSSSRATPLLTAVS